MHSFDEQFLPRLLSTSISSIVLSSHGRTWEEGGSLIISGRSVSRTKYSLELLDHGVSGDLQFYDDKATLDEEREWVGAHPGLPPPRFRSFPSTTIFKFSFLQGLVR